MASLFRELISAGLRGAAMALAAGSEAGKAFSTLRAEAAPNVVSVNAVPAFLSTLRTSVPPSDDPREIRAGSLDPAFGGGGAVVTSASKGNALALAVHTDGSYVVAGASSNERGYPSITIARYDHGGHPVKSFGKTGCVRLDLAYPPDARNDTVATSVAIQADGSIVVAGMAQQPPSAFSFEDLVLARLTSGGRLDSSFANGGWLQLRLGMASAANALSVDADGRILLAGYVRVPQSGNFQILLMRVTSDGNRDLTYGSGGFVVLPASSNVEKVAAIATQAQDGRVVGAAVQETGFDKKFVFFRLEPDGRLDTTFGNEGRLSLDLGGGDNVIKSIAIQPDGKVVAAGYLEKREYVLLRLDRMGNLDPTFGAGGILTGSFGSGAGSFGEALIVQDDGAIVLGGSVTERLTSSGYVGSMPTHDADRACAVARFLPDGQVDRSFGVGGAVLTGLDDGVSEIHAIALDGDTVVAAGQCERGIALMRFQVRTRKGELGKQVRQGSPAKAARAGAPATKARRPVSGAPVSAGQLDRRFAGQGAAFAPFGGSARARSMCIQADGRIVVAGDADAGNDPPSTDLAVIRLEPDGTIDEGFGNRGLALIGFSDSDDRAYAVHVQQDGKITVAGESHDNKTDKRDLLVVRLTPAGKRDTDFGEHGVMLSPGFFGAGAASSCVICVQADGAILAAEAGASGPLRLARYGSNGRQDLHFGTDGTASAAIAGSTVEARAMTTQPDGKIVVAASVRSAGEHTPRDFGIARFNADGTIDRSFGADGWTVIDLKDTDDRPHAVAVQRDGTILVAGEAVIGADEQGPRPQVVIARLDRDGVLDRSFNGWGGVLVPDLSGGAYALALEPDGAVLAAGFVVLADTASDVAEGGERLKEADHFAVVRCNADGSLDRTFGIAGVARIDLGGEEEWASAIMVQPTGHVLLAGTSRAQGRAEFVVARLHGTAPRDAAEAGR